MKRIDFDIKYRPEIESGRYSVQTRDGRKVRIICWDKRGGECPIIALVGDIEELCQPFYEDGRFFRHRADDFDLVILTDEPELSEFEKELSNCVKAYSAEITNPNFDDWWIKREAKKLYDLARKKLEPEEIKRLEEAYLKQYDIAKKDIMKDMPKWEAAASIAYGNQRYTVMTLLKDGSYLYDSFLGRKISISDLEKLPGLND